MAAMERGLDASRPSGASSRAGRSTGGRPAARAGVSRNAAGPPLGGAGGAASILALQRSVGNRAVSAMLASRPPVAVQRKMSFTADILASTRSSTGMLKGLVTRDSLWRLGQALLAYESMTDRSQEIAALKIIQGMCQQYTTKHGAFPRDAVKVATVRNLSDEVGEELAAEKMRADTQGEAMDIYLKDLAAAEAAPRADRAKHGFSQLRTTDGASGAKAVHGGGPDLGADDTAAHKIAASTGLTVAHLASIRVFGAVSGDYKYMNPVMAGDDAWLGSAEKKSKDPKTNRAMKEEGGLHAAIALDGMRKLPRQVSELWRGETRAPERVPKKGTTITLPTIQSWSPDRAVSYGFVMPTPGQIGVMFHIDRCTQGRTVSALKGEGMSAETEMTLLPGYTYKVVSVKRNPTDDIIEIECREVGP